jgi:hypothetical protein
MLLYTTLFKCFKNGPNHVLFFLKKGMSRNRHFLGEPLRFLADACSCGRAFIRYALMRSRVHAVARCRAFMRSRVCTTLFCLLVPFITFFYYSFSNLLARLIGAKFCLLSVFIPLSTGKGLLFANVYKI